MSHLENDLTFVLDNLSSKVEKKEQLAKAQKRRTWGKGGMDSEDGIGLMSSSFVTDLPKRIKEIKV
jgi:hypothetical protein